VTRVYKRWDPIVSQAAEIVNEYSTSVTLRQVFYRLVASGAIRNREADYKHLSRLTADARRQGWFPPLLDRTRKIETLETHKSPVDGLNNLATTYLRDRLESHATSPMIVVEKATLVEQVRSWFDELSIPVAALRGYASESFEREIVDFVSAQKRQVVMLYCGDFDPSGEDIPRAFEENTELELRRVALLPEHVEEYGLPPAPGKASDTRSGAFIAKHGRLIQVELEALPPDVLRGLLQVEVNQIVDRKRIAQVRTREAFERQRLLKFASSWVSS